MTIRTDDPTKLPGIPKAPAGATAEEKRWYDTIAQIMEIRLGLRGDPRDRAITLRELISSGLAVELRASPFNPNAVGGTAVGFAGEPLPILSVPPTPTGFTAAGAYSQVNLFWDFPLYTNHAHAEIYRHSADVLGDAVLIGIEQGRSFVDAVGSGQTNYYWIRYINQDDVPGPFNATAGTLGATAADVALLLDVLDGAITSSELANSLSTPIAAIPGIQNTLGGINTDISGINTNISGINTNLSALTSSTNTDISGINTDISGINSDISGINTDISGLSTSVNTINTTLASTVSTSSLTTALGSYTTTTSLESNYYTKNNADSAIQAAVLGLASTTEVNTALGAYTNTADLTNNYYTKTSADSATSAAINTFNTNTLGADYTNTADLTTNYYTKTTADSAISAAISTYNTDTINANFTNSADLVANHYTKTNADSAISAAINTFNTNTLGANYTNTADLTQNYYTKTTADSAISAAINTFNTNTLGANYTNTADLVANHYTKTNADSAISAAINTFNTNTLGANYTNTADLTTNYYTKTNADSAISAAITSFNSNTLTPNYSTTASIAQNYYTKTDTDTSFAATEDLIATYAQSSIDLAQPFATWTLNGQTIQTISDGKVGNETLRLTGPGGFPNQGNYIAFDPAKKYEVKFWARPSSNCAGLLYFTLRQFINNSGATTGLFNGGRSPYKPSAQSRAAHNTQFGTTDDWGEYIYEWDSSDWQSAAKYIQPEFLDNYADATGHWDVQGLSIREVTDLKATKAEVQVQAQSINGLEAQYTVKIDANGSVAGFGLASTTSAAGSNTSEFYVNANRFAILPDQVGTADPAWQDSYAYANGARVKYNGDLYIARIAHSSGTGNAPPNASFWVAGATVPFTVQTTGTTTSGGVYIPPGVYMNSAMIKHATITAAQIGSIDADTITTGTLNADFIDGGTIDASTVNIAGTGTGINLKSADTGARMEIASNVIKIYDANRLRVKLGQI